MALQNLKALMKEKNLSDNDADDKKPGFLKRKPMKDAPKKMTGLAARLTGGK